jgi:serine/threonine protein kinase
LEVSLNKDNFDQLGTTYRDEGLSIGADHMRLFGEEVQFEVSFSDLVIGSILGKGACSSVYMAHHKRSGDRYAVKVFNVFDRTQASQLYNEILLLTSFQCDALISLKGAFHDHGSIGIILEFMDRGTLEFIKDPRIQTTELAIAGVTFQMIWGLAYLHYEKQIHRDVKPGNVLINSYGQVKLSDFGISKELDSTTALSNTSVGSNPYMSPERLEGDRYDASSDVWAVGISIIELWEKKYPFSSIRGSPIDLCGEIKRFRYDDWMPSDKFPYLMKQFIISMLAPNPGDRATSYELTTAPWLMDCRILSLEDAQRVVHDWLTFLDSNQRPSLSLETKDIHHPQTQHRGISALKARDLCEMSMSLDTSKNNLIAGDELGISRSMNNPFTSSGNLYAAIATGNSKGFSGLEAKEDLKLRRTDKGAKEIEEFDNQGYEEDFDEEVEPMDVDTRYDHKRNDGYRKTGHK